MLINWFKAIPEDEQTSFEKRFDAPAKLSSASCSSL